MRSRRGFGILAVCGLVLGMMAISASGAQAGKWMVAGSNVAGELTVGAAVELEGGSATLLSTSGGNAIAITCTTATVTSAVVTVGTITGTVNFSGCTTKINGTLQASCEPKNQPVATGGTITAVLHSGVAYAKALGTETKILKEGKEETVFVFATFKFSCVSLPSTVKVTGTGWLEDCNNEFETEKVTHLVQEAMVPALALGGLLFGANAAEIDGSANVAFNDATHKGLKFSGLAE